MTSPTAVRFFPASSSTTTSSCSTGDTSCCGPSVTINEPGITVEALAQHVQEHFGTKVFVEVASYWTEAEVGSAIAKLNEMLRASGNSFEVTPVNFYTFVESVAPIVAVGDQILCTRRLPDWDELRTAIEKVEVTV